MGQTVSFEDFKKEQKRRERQEWVNDKIHKTANWIERNKEFLAVAIPATGAIVAGGTKMVRSISRNVALSQERRLKERTIYDRSMGRYVELKRPIKSSELKQILERKENGEKLSTILLSMNLVK